MRQALTVLGVEDTAKTKSGMMVTPQSLQPAGKARH